MTNPDAKLVEIKARTPTRALLITLKTRQEVKELIERWAQAETDVDWLLQRLEVAENVIERIEENLYKPDDECPCCISPMDDHEPDCPLHEYRAPEND